MSKAVKLSDIANIVGVSIVTVSKALSDQKGVSEELRTKIKAVASELGYKQPSVARKESIRYHSHRFGVLIAVALLVIAVGFAVGKNKSVRLALVSAGIVCAVCFSVLLFNGRSDVVMRVFPDGAIVCTYDSKTVVCGINTKGDYYKVKSYLQSNMLYVDFLVVDNSSSYCAMLSNDVAVNTLLCDEFDDTILSSADCQRLEVQSVYNVLLDDDYNLCYNQGGVTLYIKDFSISTYQNADFTVNSKSITDGTGCIELKNGTVDYRISSRDSYKVRRLNQWQK